MCVCLRRHCMCSHGSWVLLWVLVCSPAYMTEPRLCICSLFFLRYEGIGIDRVSLALDAWWLMVWRWFISHVRGAGSRRKALLSLSFEALAVVFHLLSLSAQLSLSLALCYCRPTVPFYIWLWSCLVGSNTTSKMSCPHAATLVSFYRNWLKRAIGRHAAAFSVVFMSLFLLALVSFSLSDWRPNSLLITGFNR